MHSGLIAFPLLALAACSAGNSQPRDTGPAGSRGFAVDGFDAVSLEGSDNVRVVRGSATSVTATGPSAVLDKLDIRVVGTTLKVGRKRQGWSMGWNSDKGALVTVTVPVLNAAAVAGSGTMNVDRADGDSFDAAVAGSGSLQLATLAVKRAKMSVAGSGNLTVSGTADDSKLAITGSGNIDADKLVSQRADIALRGSGNVTVAASKSAAISIAGSGDVTVTGTDKCTISKVGSGEARCSR